MNPKRRNYPSANKRTRMLRFNHLRNLERLVFLMNRPIPRRPLIELINTKILRFLTELPIARHVRDAMAATLSTVH